MKRNSTPFLHVVGGTAFGSIEAENCSSPEPIFRRRAGSAHSEDLPLTETASNGRLRNKRRAIWWAAEAATRYWSLRLDFERAVGTAQRYEIPEGSNHPVVDNAKDRQLVQCFREAVVRQLLTPAWDVASIKWKQTTFARNQHRYVDVKPERIKRAIADDEAWLAAHPVRRKDSEAAQRRRDFREAMRRRIRDVAASRDLSDEEIKPALTLRHQKIAQFSEQHGVRIEWLIEGKGSIFKPAPIEPYPGRCELTDVLDGD